MMLTAVAAELASPRLARRVGFGRLLGAGVVLLGAPALLFPAVEGLTRVPPLGMAVLTGLSVVRGLGFALVVVAVGTIAAHAFPESRRGEGMGVLGVVAMVPAVTMLPLGVWLSQVASYPSVFAAAALCAFAVLPLTARLNAPATGDPSSATQAASACVVRGSGDPWWCSRPRQLPVAWSSHSCPPRSAPAWLPPASSRRPLSQR